VRLDPHVHTLYSGQTTIRPLHRIMRESYNTPAGVYRRAKQRGMDLVAITDHDAIEGALSIADRPDVVVGCEVTAVFPDDGVVVHLGVLDITEAQHEEIQRLRRNVHELMLYLQQQRIFTTLNHVASRINGRITPRHIAALLPWLNALEVRNGSRLSSQNRTAAAIAASARKIGIAGSDAHTQRGIGRTWIEVEGATTREEFMSGLHAGRVAVGGREGHFFTMASDILRLASSFYLDRSARVLGRPFDWREHAVLLGGVIGMPLVVVPVALAYVHFVLEESFNRSLLVDLVAKPLLSFVEES
jgi:predicted metal-dependent phosphoesterase TrpH